MKEKSSPDVLIYNKNKEGLVKVDVYALAGAGSPKDLIDNEPIDTIMVPSDFMKPSIVPIKIKGESMEPTIYEGAVVGIDKEDKEIISGKIYAVWLPYEGAVIKRIFIDIDKVILKSDNISFPEISLPFKELDDNFILGRVKWIIQRL